MTNSQLNYIHNLLIKHKRKLRNNVKKNPTDSELTKIITAFEIIESDNRFIVWRLIEYTAVLFNWLLHLFLNRPIVNFSIGKYQLKINLVLEDLKLDHRVEDKEIEMKSKLNLGDIIKIISLSNNYSCFERILRSKFNLNWDQLASYELEKVALFYSRNIEFKGAFNYYIVLKTLYYNSDYEPFGKDSDLGKCHFHMSQLPVIKYLEEADIDNNRKI